MLPSWANSNCSCQKSTESRLKLQNTHRYGKILRVLSCYNFSALGEDMTLRMRSIGSEQQRRCAGTAERASVAVDGRGNVFVHDGYINGRIQVFRISDGAYVRSLCSKGSGPGQLQGEGSISFDVDGNIVVADGGNHRLQILRYSDGALLRTIGIHGTGAGEFNYPVGFAFDDAGHVIVADCANHRVQVLRYVDGTHVRTIGSGGSALGQFNRIYGVAIDRAGCIFAADCLNHRIQVLH